MSTAEIQVSSQPVSEGQQQSQSPQELLSLDRDVTLEKQQELFQTGVPRRPVEGESALVVRFSENESNETASLESDLAVMSHLLRSTISEKFGALQGQKNVLGVNVSFVPGSKPIRTIYIQDYGALFLLEVGFPLDPSLKSEDAPKEKEATDSTWEQAKKEYYGIARGRRGFSAPDVPYDQQRADALKEALLEALRNASNIRGLKPNDSISVCVAGSNTIRPIADQGQPGKGGEGTDILWPRYGNAGVQTQRSFFSIRVKKSDVDALSAGRMTTEVFAKRAMVGSYLALDPSPGSRSVRDGVFGIGSGTPDNPYIIASPEIRQRFLDDSGK